MKLARIEHWRCGEPISWKGRGYTYIWVLNTVLECSHPYELNHAYGSLIVRIPHISQRGRNFSRDRWIRVRNFVNRTEWEKEAGLV